MLRRGLSASGSARRCSPARSPPCRCLARIGRRLTRRRRRRRPGQLGHRPRLGRRCDGPRARRGAGSVAGCVRLRLPAAAVITVACSSFVACGSDGSTSETAATQRARRRPRVSRSHARPADRSALDGAESMCRRSPCPIPSPPNWSITELTPATVPRPPTATSSSSTTSACAARTARSSTPTSAPTRSPSCSGQGGVIAGWDQGLVGAQAGQRLQLDIPTTWPTATSAGRRDQGRRRALVRHRRTPPSARPPTRPSPPTVPASRRRSAATEVTSSRMLVESATAAPLEEANRPTMHLVAARGDNGDVLQSTWETEEAARSRSPRRPLLAGHVRGHRRACNLGGRRADHDPVRSLGPRPPERPAADLCCRRPAPIF